MKKILFLCLAASLSLASCSSADKKASKKQAGTAIEQAAQSNHIISGAYSGTLPCADCPGIATTLTFKAQNRVTKTTLYLESDDAENTVKGTYKVKNDSLVVITFPDDTKEFYRITSDTSLVMLNADKEKVTGPMADHYVLTKNNR